MYTNQGVAGGVTVVPQGVVQGRQAVGSRAVPVDGRTITSWRSGSKEPSRGIVPVAPPPPARVVAVPGGAVPAVPAPPGSVRTIPWSQRGSRTVGAAQGDGGQAPRGVARVPGSDPRTAGSDGRRTATPPAAQHGAAPQRQPGAQPPPTQRGEARPAQRPERDQRGERRGVAPVAVPKGAPATVQRVPPPTVHEPSRPQRGVPQQGAQVERERARSEARDAPQRGPDDRARRVRDPRADQVR
jgi:hypothetical protein